MTHGDDDGIILPPKVASAHVVLLPIVRKSEDRESVMDFTEKLALELRAKTYHHRKMVVEIDDREIGGARGWDWIKKGIDKKDDYNTEKNCNKIIPTVSQLNVHSSYGYIYQVHILFYPFF